MMTEEQKLSIIDSGKEYFRNIIIPQHIKNLKKLKLKSFKINPFTVSYIASFLCGNTKPESLAKALVYPRVLGTSINTSFGTHAQFFISKVSEIAGSASGIEGIDIEFIDALDENKKPLKAESNSSFYLKYKLSIALLSLNLEFQKIDENLENLKNCLKYPIRFLCIGSDYFNDNGNISLMDNDLIGKFIDNEKIKKILEESKCKKELFELEYEESCDIDNVNSNNL